MVGRGDIDGIAVVAGLHIDGHVEFAARLVAVFLGTGLHGEDYLAHIALAANLVVEACAIEGQLHIEHGRATSVKGTHKVAQRVAHACQWHLGHRVFGVVLVIVPYQCLHRCIKCAVTIRIGQLVDIGALARTAYPAVGHDGILRHIVRGDEGHGEAVVRAVVGAAIPRFMIGRNLVGVASLNVGGPH